EVAAVDGAADRHRARAGADREVGRLGGGGVVAVVRLGVVAGPGDRCVAVHDRVGACVGAGPTAAARGAGRGEHDGGGTAHGRKVTEARSGVHDLGHDAIVTDSPLAERASPAAAGARSILAAMRRTRGVAVSVLLVAAAAPRARADRFELGAFFGPRVF